MVDERLYSTSPISQARGMYDKAYDRYNKAKETDYLREIMELYNEAGNLFRALINYWSEFFNPDEISKMEEKLKEIESMRKGSEIK